MQEEDGEQKTGAERRNRPGRGIPVIFREIDSSTIEPQAAGSISEAIDPTDRGKRQSAP
jgi:hypothetical protein